MIRFKAILQRPSQMAAQRATKGAARSAALVSAILLTLATSCTYKPLCYLHPHTADLQIVVDWSKSRYERYDDGEGPSGMTLAAYRRDGASAPVFISTNNINGMTLRLAEGEYDFLLFNQSFTEFGTYTFHNQNSYDDISIESVESKVSWYSKADPEERFSRNPEWIAAARAEGLRINAKSFELKSSRADNSAVFTEDGKLLLTPLTPVQKAMVIVRINGYQNLASMRGVITGFSRGWYMGPDIYSEKQTSYSLSGWSAMRNPDDYTKGVARTGFQLLGLPFGFTETPPEVQIYLECLLVDGKTVKSFHFNVGDRIRQVKADVDTDVDVDIDIDIEIEIDLPDVGGGPPPEGGGSGFAVNVGDWDEEVITSIPLE